MENRLFVKLCFQNVVASGHICRFVEAADRGVALDCQISQESQLRVKVSFVGEAQLYRMSN